MDNPEKLYFAIGTVCMALGAVAFLLMGRGDKPEKQHHYVVSAFIVITAACSYLAMTLGQGKVDVVGIGAAGTLTRTFYYARFADWAITTPLLLLGLASIAVTHIRARGTLIAGLMGADLLMIVTGLFAGLSTGANVYIWFTVSTGAFLAVLALLWTSLLHDANQQPAPWAALYKRQTAILTALWIAYPIVFLIGTEALKLIPSRTETLIFMLLDVTAKIVFSFLLLSGLKSLTPRSYEEDVRPDRASSETRGADEHIIAKRPITLVEDSNGNQKVNR